MKTIHKINAGHYKVSDKVWDKDPSTYWGQKVEKTLKLKADLESEFGMKKHKGKDSFYISVINIPNISESGIYWVYQAASCLAAR